ncbi:hypothetical protein NE237_001720 [Protea cynaroides]|uniref:Uncharacterized protein n=1 Tax=Protea cynaroides TaxID=273540 RepID=A0A9Q0KUN6_9MAGN|nr:hypothetical protein NE237_001720 [Protea cynaroides]
MRQKIVVKVQMNHQNCRKKALQIAASIYGVDEMRIEGEERDQLAVIGESVDSIRLVRCLRKKVGHAYILSLNVVTPESQQGNPQPPPQQENPGSNPIYFPQECSDAQLSPSRLPRSMQSVSISNYHSAKSVHLRLVTIATEFSFQHSNEKTDLIVGKSCRLRWFN